MERKTPRIVEMYDKAQACEAWSRKLAKQEPVTSKISAYQPYDQYCYKHLANGSTATCFMILKLAS
jgi:hypothetical protein